MKLRFIFGLLMLGAIMVLSGACGKKADTENMMLYVKAHELYAAAQFSQAAGLLEGVNKFSPALILRAKAEYFSGNPDKAEKSCRRAIKYQPASFEAKLLLARVLREKGEMTNAQELAEGILADNPNDIRLLRFAATLAGERGDAAEAAVLLDRAAELSAEGAMVLLDRARLRWIAGRSTDALEDLSRAGAMIPAGTPVSRSINQLEKRITEAMQ